MTVREGLKIGSETPDGGEDIDVARDLKDEIARRVKRGEKLSMETAMAAVLLDLLAEVRGLREQLAELKLWKLTSGLP